MRRIFAAWRARVRNRGAAAPAPAGTVAARVVLAGLDDPAATARDAARQARALGLALHSHIHEGAAAQDGRSLELRLEGPEPALRQALAGLLPLDPGGGAAAPAVAIGATPVSRAPAGAPPPLPAPPFQTPALQAATAQYHALTRALSDALYAPVRDSPVQDRAPRRRKGPPTDPPADPLADRAALVALCEAILPPHLHDNVQRDMGGYPGHAGLSFAAEIRAQGQLRRTLQQRCGHAQEFLLEDKANGRAFARALGLRLPVLHQQDVPADRVVLRPDTVIKPLRGGNSTGVFVVDSAGRIDRLRPAARVLDEAALRAAMAQLVAQGRADRWLVEDRLPAAEDPGADAGVNGPRLPTDIKVYSFYGRTPLALEVDRNGPAPRYAWHRHPHHTPRTEAGPPPIGKYDAARFDSTTDPAPFFRLAARISRDVPAPFLRIDFLNTAAGPVYGEFTPRPGQFHSFHPRADRWLGWECVRARAHLLADLAPGVLAAPPEAADPAGAGTGAAAKTGTGTGSKDFALFRAFVAQALAAPGSPPG